MPRIRSKAYRVTLPSSYTDDDIQLIESWAFDSCYRTTIVTTDEDHAVWVAVREKTRSKCEWLRSVRGVFAALRLDTRPLAGDGWLTLCVEPEALEILRAASNSRNAQQIDDTAQEDGTHDMLMPSARKRFASSRAGTNFEIVRT